MLKSGNEGERFVRRRSRWLPPTTEGHGLEPQKTPTRELVSIRLSRDGVASFRASGNGWQTRLDRALKDWLRTHQPGLSRREAGGPSAPRPRPPAGRCRRGLGPRRCDPHGPATRQRSPPRGSLQSAATLKTEGSLWEAALRACGLHPEAQHPRLDGNGASDSHAGIALSGDGGGDHFASTTQAQDRADE
ncbi:MAG: BrnA antitoxin family protein [Geothrix sp.]|nr:BrnA antitoxin family protein [Geothrix sp.]